MGVMAIYFMIGNPNMADDGFHYQGFTESLSRGVIDFKSFYGFMGLSILSVPVYWLTNSSIAVIYTSMLMVMLSIPLAYQVGKHLYGTERAGVFSLIIFLLTPYPYTTLMRGFQEGALSFFILLIIYGSIRVRSWTGLAWAFAGIVKPFSLSLFPLFLPDLFKKKNIIWFLIIGLIIGLSYLLISYAQVGHFINNAAINSYSGSFDTGNPPPLVESFTIGIKGFLRIGANFLLAYRKIMISPFIVIVGSLMLLMTNKVPFRSRFISSVILNILLVGLLTFSFSKYILPAAIILGLASIPFIERKWWYMVIVFVDSISVFIPIWNFFGMVYWPKLVVYLIPFWTAILMYIIFESSNKKHAIKG